ncbi:MAG: LemA family protein [Elusimicrobiota bacterium]
MMTPLIVAVCVVALLVFWGISIFNNLVQVRENIDKAWKNIDVLLQQRHDELIKLVDACRGYMKHERELLDGLTKLRTGYDQAQGSEEKARAENELNKATLRLRHTWEAYPDLKASANFIQLQDRVGALESSISDRREFFNDSVNIYNISIKRFPDLLLAGVSGYRVHPYLEIPDEKKADVKLDFESRRA